MATGRWLRAEPVVAALLTFVALASTACTKRAAPSLAPPVAAEWLVRNGKTLGAPWSLYVWPVGESKGLSLPSAPKDATDCFGLVTHSNMSSCDLNLIPGKALVVAHSTPISGKDRFLFYGAVDGRGVRLVFRFADGSTLEQPLFASPRWPGYKFFVAAPPQFKGPDRNFQPIVYDAGGRELKPGK